MKKISFLFLLAVLIQSCGPRVVTSLSNTKFTPLAKDAEILVLDPEDTIPENSSFVGDLKIGDSGFSNNCGYTVVMKTVKRQARLSGANVVHITKVKQPNFGSTCYRIYAKLYQNSSSDMAEYKLAIEEKDMSQLPAEADYAMVYFYRPRNFSGAAIGYKIRMDDETVIGRVRNGEKFSCKVTDFGEHTFWAKTETNASVVIDVKKGQEYFVRCSIKMGAMVGRPEINIVPNHLARKTYDKM